MLILGRMHPFHLTRHFTVGEDSVLGTLSGRNSVSGTNTDRAGSFLQITVLFGYKVTHIFHLAVERARSSQLGGGGRHIYNLVSLPLLRVSPICIPGSYYEAIRMHKPLGIQHKNGAKTSITPSSSAGSPSWTSEDAGCSKATFT